MSGTVTDVLRVAQGEIGNTEFPFGSNHQKYGAWYGMNGVAWCGIFVSWCEDQAGVPFAMTTSKGFASVDLAVAWFKRNNAWSATPKPGYVSLYTFEHCGLVESVRPDGSIIAIEGNTDVKGGASGGRVMRQVRARSLCLGFGIPKYLADSPVGTQPLPTGQLNAAATAIASSPSGNGYLLIGEDGGAFTYGDVGYYGSGLSFPHQRMVDAVVTRDGRGYYMVAQDGGVFAFGSARFYGSTGSIKLNKPIVGMELTASGNGYWLVAADGGIFAFGDAPFYGSAGSIALQAPVVAMSVSPSGRGYYLYAADGGVFSYGDAKFLGSMGGHRLNASVIAGATMGSRGYIMAGTDGGAFDFGYPAIGSLAGKTLNGPITDVAARPDGTGFWMVGSDGGVFAFNAPYFGSPTK